MKKDIAIGAKFERLTVTQRIDGRPARYECMCSCGKTTVVICYQLTSNKTKSCGCLSREGVSKTMTTHGMRGSPEYKAWAEAKGRCHNEKSEKYKWYGARGIEMCEEWRNDFMRFYEHIGAKPTRKHELDRINNDKGYEPGNVRWATRITQVRNRSNAIYVKKDGVTMHLTEFAKVSGIKYATAWARYKRSPESFI